MGGRGEEEREREREGGGEGWGGVWGERERAINERESIMAMVPACTVNVTTLYMYTSIVHVH